jgi:hypothetical protein
MRILDYKARGITPPRDVSVVALGLLSKVLVGFVKP